MNFTAETTTPESQNRAFRGPRTRRRGEESGDRIIGADHGSPVCPEDDLFTIRLSGKGFSVSASPRLRGEFGSSIARRFLGTIVAVIREIFDESAYDRFLARTHSTRSIASYREFIQERESGAATRPRCC